MFSWSKFQIRASLHIYEILFVCLLQKKVKKEHINNNKKAPVKKEKAEPKSEEKKRKIHLIHDQILIFNFVG